MVGACNPTSRRTGHMGCLPYLLLFVNALVNELFAWEKPSVYTHANIFIDAA